MATYEDYRSGRNERKKYRIRLQAELTDKCVLNNLLSGKCTCTYIDATGTNQQKHVRIKSFVFSNGVYFTNFYCSAGTGNGDVISGRSGVAKTGLKTIDSLFVAIKMAAVSSVSLVSQARPQPEARSN